MKKTGSIVGMEERNLRGRAAIEAAHSRLLAEDEPRLNFSISAIYGVDTKEAMEIHADFHMERILAILLKRVKQHGMSAKGLSDILPSLDLFGVSTQVALGSLREVAAADLLFNAIRLIQSNGKIDDRYIAFYG